MGTARVAAPACPAFSQGGPGNGDSAGSRFGFCRLQAESGTACVEASSACKVGRWPISADALVEKQSALGEEAPTPWAPTTGFVVGGCFVCFERGQSGPGRAGERAWAAATAADTTAAVTGVAGAGYE